MSEFFLYTHPQTLVYWLRKENELNLRECVCQSNPPFRGNVLILRHQDNHCVVMWVLMCISRSVYSDSTAGHLHGHGVLWEHMHADSSIHDELKDIPAPVSSYTAAFSSPGSDSSMALSVSSKLCPEENLWQGRIYILRGESQARESKRWLSKHSAWPWLPEPRVII